ncbi:site-specific integrase [Rhabdobacter roseus]
MYPSDWAQKEQCIRGKDRQAAEDNEKLRRLKDTLIRIKDQYIESRGTHPTPSDIVRIWKGHDELHITLDAVIAEFLKDLRLRKRSKGTLARYERSLGFMREYLKENRRLRQISSAHFKGFFGYLREQKGHSNDYSNKIIGVCKGLFIYARRMEYIEKNPLGFIRLEWEKGLDTTHLTIDELKLISEYDWNNSRLQRVAEAFLFMCYTGLNISDYLNLKTSDIELIRVPLSERGFYEQEMIIQVREKATLEARGKGGMTSRVPLHEEAKRLIEKYGSVENLPRISKQKMNEYLKVIQEKTGIQKHFTNRLARKTFADIHLNVYRMSREAVASMVGHVDTKQINHYCSIREERILAEWKNRPQANVEISTSTQKEPARPEQEIMRGVFRIQRGTGT